MRSVEDHLTLVTAAAVAPRPVRVAISEAQGLMCAEEVVTEHPMPGFDQAAIDGYAVRAVDVGLAGVLAPEDLEDFDANGAELVDLEPGEPMIVSLPVVGEVGPGSRTPTRLQPRQAVRVETGAPMPTLADAVVPLRWTDGGDQKVKIGHGVESGNYVRRVGDDVQPGDVAVRAGSIIGPAQVGLLAAVGQARVMVHPRPRLSVISVGSELVDIDRTPGPGQIYDVNSYALAAAGPVFPLLAPIIGWIGVFLTGSVVNNNTLFAPLQVATADKLSVDPSLFVAANTAGGNTAKVISPQSIAIAAGAVGLSGRESEILRASILYSLGMLAFVCVWSFVLSLVT